jgi:hypothetical protein
MKFSDVPNGFKAGVMMDGQPFNPDSGNGPARSRLRRSSGINV